jgi:hypothetical protein
MVVKTIKQLFCRHYYLNDMFTHQMSMTCIKCNKQVILSTERVVYEGENTNHDQE